MKKYSSREKRLLQMMIGVVLFALLQSAWGRFQKSKETMRLRIESERTAQQVYWDKLEQIDEERLSAQMARFDETLKETRQRVLRMPNESEAIFKVQEHLSDMGEKAQLGMNSQNKRRSEQLSEDSPYTELRTYFGYDCELGDILSFFNLMKDQDIYYAIDTLNINSYRRRRSRRPGRDEDPNIDRVRGSMVISTLYESGKPFVKPSEDDAPPPPEGETVQSEPKVETERPPTKRPNSVTSLRDQIVGPAKHAKNPLESAKLDEPPPISGEGKSMQPEPKPMTHPAQKKKKDRPQGRM